MKRRDFLALMTLLSTAPTTLLSQKNTQKRARQEWVWIEAVYETLFPKTATMPSAKEFGAIEYLQKNIGHITFDKDDRDFILQGARDFKKAYPNFLHVKEKIKILKELQTNNYGNSWLDTLIYYGIEAMMSEPIYGGNKKRIGWKSVGHIGGEPVPKRRYIKGFDGI